MRLLPIADKVKYETLPELVDDADKLLLGVLNKPLHGGYAEQEKATAIIRKIQTAKKEGQESVIIENEEWNYLVEALRAFPFRVYDPAFFEWLTKIITLSEFTPAK